MKKPLLFALVAFMTGVTPLLAQGSATLSFSGSTTWAPGTVPEPSTLALLTLAAVGFGVLVYRGRKDRLMEKAVLFGLIGLTGLTGAVSPLLAQQSSSLSFSGPTVWSPGASVVLSATDTYSGFGGGSVGLSYWLEVSSSFAPYLTITGLTYFTFTNGNNIGTFPFSFNSTSGADSGFMTTRTANGQSGDLGGTSSPFIPILEGSYHVTDITFALAAGAPTGTFTVRTTTANPRSSIQVASDFGDHPISQSSFVFTVVPEPSTLALLGIQAVGAGALLYRGRKNRRSL